jgi:CDP-diacylglycerol--glycerol-3-phosphate 3-phosphatidyltransferase
MTLSVQPAASPPEFRCPKREGQCAMPQSTATTDRPSLLNVPNQLTLARIFLSVVLFVFLVCGWYATSFAIFVITAATDWIDGYWARKYGQITQFGRVLDPFADKLLICGTYILLAGVPPLADGTIPSGIAPWMAVVVVGRELLVTALRTFVEQQGGDFSAKWAGKWKMVLQCIAAGWSFVHLTYVDQAANSWAATPPEWMTQGLMIVVWAAVLLTVYSAVGYVRAAMVRFRNPS